MEECVNAEDPTIICPANVTTVNDSGMCSAAVNFSVPVGATTERGFQSGQDFVVGTSTDTYMTTEATGNTATCSFEVTVIDAEAPIQEPATLVPMCLDPKPSGRYFCQEAASKTFVTGTDNCGVAAVTFAGCVANQPDKAGRTPTCVYDPDSDRLCFKAARGGDNRVDPNKTGKTYTASFEAVDTAGNKAMGTRDVFVPRKRRRDVPDIDQCFKGNHKARWIRRQFLSCNRRKDVPGTDQCFNGKCGGT